jgi:uncharacterized alkaline shock family protein YloU
MSTEETTQERERLPGSTTIAPGVLITIARLTACSVPGVVGMAPVPGGVNRLFRRGVGEGVRIEVEDNTVSVDLYLELALGSNMRDVGRRVQAEVARAIKDMVGMEVREVNVHIEDVYPEEPETSGA